MSFSQIVPAVKAAAKASARRPTRGRRGLEALDPSVNHEMLFHKTTRIHGPSRGASAKLAPTTMVWAARAMYPSMWQPRSI
eukprot:scaffold228_cov312-Pinguiococcus_pyrenoidosus.AAC.55